jgi:signal transduction histidine kinase
VSIIEIVQNFGTGRKKDLLNKVFERFLRVSESKLNTFPGLGPGLYIAGEIIKRQGGTISAKSTDGKGFTFCFSFPTKHNEKG